MARSEKMSETKQAARRRRIFELRCLGMTIPQISIKLKEEGFVIGTSEHTVWRDLHTDEVKQYTDELLRRQLADITLSNKGSIRMKYRDKLLSKIMPHKIEQKTESRGELTVDIPDLEGLHEKAVSAIVENFMDSEARRLRQENREPS